MSDEKTDDCEIQAKAGTFRCLCARAQANTAPDRTAILNSFVMTKDNEVFSIVIRHADKLEEDAKRGVQTLDGMRHMLQEYNEVDRHTIPLTGDLVE